jgi:hypothetical protein
MRGRRLILIAVGLAVLAGGLRFFRLGAFPFAGDELATTTEARVLFGQQEAAAASQTDRLPRLIPLSYSIHALDYALFGTDEFGSRVLMAVLGTLSVVLIFLGLAGPLGETAALVTALLVAVWPEHLFECQQNRFYITAWLFSTLAVMLGARAVQGRSAAWTVAACLAALAAVLSHTLQVVLLPGLFAAVVVSAWRGRQPVPRSVLAVIGGAGVVTAAVVVVLMSLGKGWNAGASWGYSPVHGLINALNRTGWPTVLLAGLGVVLALARQMPGGAYWLTWLGVWLGASAVLPMLVVYHPGYTFPLTFVVFVLAGSAAATVAARLSSLDRRLSCAWVAAVVLLGLPSVASHYLDGSRFDYRTAAGYVAKNWQPGDRVAAVSAGLLEHYAKLDTPPVPISRESVDALKRAAEGPGRLWIVMPSNRGGKPEAVREWLGKHCSQELVVRQPRLDYHEFAVEVFVYRPDGRTELASR